MKIGRFVFFYNFSLKEQLIKSVYTSTNNVKETNEQYQQQIKMLEKVDISKR